AYPSGTTDPVVNTVTFGVNVAIADDTESDSPMPFSFATSPYIYPDATEKASTTFSTVNNSYTVPNPTSPILPTVTIFSTPPSQSSLPLGFLLTFTVTIPQSGGTPFRTFVQDPEMVVEPG
ncbi:MAG TPA: hypothetical protein VN851_06975, partial [Thermoanaerobaculia bacterium]|nr:hypothetical protein [Thermoanaerobaculia bacterium]